MKIIENDFYGRLWKCGFKVTVEQVKNFYENKINDRCTLTEKLIKAGYQQESGGYIAYALECGEEVFYKNAKPSQGWHLIDSYCKRTQPKTVFSKRIKCGELLFWMAEVGKCVPYEELEILVNTIIASRTPVKRRNEMKPPVRYNRRKWNKEIQRLCFDEIVKSVDAYYRGVTK